MAGNRLIEAPWLIVGAIALVSINCASRQSPVEVVAAPAEIAALVGEWSGEYSSAQTGRSGSIVFRLKSASDTAFGDVVMIPRKSVAPVAADPSMPRPETAQMPGDVLTIRFVWLDGDKVSGRMDPYADPECGCRITTVFSGSFRGSSTIEGTFESVGSGSNHPLARGTWKVSRLAP